MADKAWKAFERRIAKIFGTTRTSLSGGNGKLSRSDSHHPDFFLSCKMRGSDALQGLYATEYPKALKENKIVVLVTKKTGAKNFMVSLSGHDLLEFATLYLRSKGFVVRRGEKRATLSSSRKVRKKTSRNRRRRISV